MTRAFMSAIVLAGGMAVPLTAQEAPTVEIAIARGVVERMPVDTASQFPADVGELTCWTRITGASGASVQHVWIHGEDEFPVTLGIGGSPWRTWSTKAIPPEWAGEWQVQVRDASGTVLATARFVVGG